MLTFVTAFIDIYKDKEGLKSVESNIDHYKKLANTGINLYVFTHLELPARDNVRFIHTTLDDMKYLDSGSSIIQLPAQRHIKKDTFEYIMLQNNKLEFVRRAIVENYFKTENFACIDFGIFYLFRNNPVDKLLKLHKEKLKPGLHFPGPWPRMASYHLDRHRSGRLAILW